jgi:hypothetical protein
MFGLVYGLDTRQVPQSLRVHPVFALLHQLPFPEQPPVPTALPTLYIGRRATESLLQTHFRALEDELDSHTWWAYSPDEDITYFIRQFERFLAQVPRTLLSAVSFQGLDPLVMGPATAVDLRARLRAPAPTWYVLEHGSGWSWWDPAQPAVVSGLSADAYYAHCNLSREQLRAQFTASAAHYVRDGEKGKPLLWLETRFDYTRTEAIRMVPFFMYLKQGDPI